MSELENKTVEQGGDVADAVKFLRDPEQAVPEGNTAGRTDRVRKVGIEELVATIKEAEEERMRLAEESVEREAKDSLMIGGLCALGVVSLIVAAWVNAWLPVAVGLGVCLSGAAGALIYRGLAVLRG